MTISVAIAGASGYAGAELIRLLSQHPHFEVKTLAAGSFAGSEVGTVHPQLGHFNSWNFVETSSETLNGHDLVLLALPHGQSAALVSGLDPKTKIVDLGADFRLQSESDWQQFYGSTPHAGSWTYGLSEIFGTELIASSQFVANPGCYATAISLGAAPGVASQIIDSSDLVVVAASGTSGAGRNATVALLGAEVMGSISAYKIGGLHQHTPEIEQTLQSLTHSEVKLSFTPLLAPMSRGIHATITAKLTRPITTAAVRAIYGEYFSDSTFVQLLAEGQQPKTSSVYGSNFVQMQVVIDEHTQRLVVTVVIDNLVKGAAGQAIQNANIMFGIAADTGLQQMGIAP